MHIKLHDYIYGFIIAHMDLINAYDTKMKYLYFIRVQFAVESV